MLVKLLRKTAKKSNVLMGKNLELITISAQLSGIESANHCGIKPLHWVSLGIIPGICWLITGNNWSEITSSSNFIMYPEPLIRRYKNISRLLRTRKIPVDGKTGMVIVLKVIMFSAYRSNIIS